MRPSTLYIGYSLGFRSGGFNQTGVDAPGIAGVNDLSDAERADTFEGGAKAEFLDQRIGANLQHRHPLRTGLSAFVRSDVEVIGPTWFYPDNFTVRDPVTLLERAARHRRQVLVGGPLGQDSHRQEIQRGVVARPDVLPESGLHDSEQADSRLDARTSFRQYRS